MNQNPFDLSANIANSSDGDGTVTAGDKLGFLVVTQVTDEFANQIELAMEKVAREVEWFAFNGTFADGANTTPGSGTREMRGLEEWIGLNANANNSVAPTYVGGNIHYCDSAEMQTSGQPRPTWDAIADGMKSLYDAHAPMNNPVLVVTRNNC